MMTPVAEEAVAGPFGRSPPSFDTKAVKRLAGVSTRQVNHWDRLGLVSPSIRRASGTGSRRLYSLQDLLVLIVAEALREHGLGLATISKVVSTVREHVLKEAPADDVVVAWDGNGGCRVARSGDAVTDVLAAHGFVFAVSVGAIARRLKEQLQSSAKPSPASTAATQPSSDETQPPDSPKRGPPTSPQETPRACTWGENW